MKDEEYLQQLEEKEPPKHVVWLLLGLFGLKTLVGFLLLLAIPLFIWWLSPATWDVLVKFFDVEFWHKTFNP